MLGCGSYFANGGQRDDPELLLMRMSRPGMHEPGEQGETGKNQENKGDLDERHSYGKQNRANADYQEQESQEIE
jgi:hypothetical protein